MPPAIFSFSASTPQTPQHHQTEESPAARRDLQLLEEHRPWEMLDNMALAIIDQTYTALLEILHRSPPPPPEEGDGHVVALSQPVESSSPDSPPQVLHVEACARHCRVFVTDSSDVGDMDREFTAHWQRIWPPRGRVMRARIGVSLGMLCLVRVDGGGRGDYWRCADEVRPDVAGRGLLGVLDTIRSRLDAAARLEVALLEKASAHRFKGDKVKEIFRAWMTLKYMRREVNLNVIVRRRRFLKRRREAEMDVDQEDEAEEVTKRLKTLQV